MKCDCVQGQREKIRSNLLSSGKAFASAIHVRQIPSSSLLKVWADVSDDTQINARVTNQLIQEFQIYMQRCAQDEQTLRKMHTQKIVETLQRQVAAMRRDLEEFRKTNETDVRLPADAMPEAQVARARLLRIVVQMEEDLEIPRTALKEAERRYLDLQLLSKTADKAPIHIVHNAE